MFEIRPVDFVHNLKVIEIRQENGGLNHVIKSESLCSQKGCDIVQHPTGLRGDIAGNDLAGLRIERNLTAAKEETSAAHRLRVGANRSGRFVRGNDLLHLADCSRKSSGHNEWSRRVRKCLGAENVLTSQNFCRQAPRLPDQSASGALALQPRCGNCPILGLVYSGNVRLSPVSRSAIPDISCLTRGGEFFQTP